MKAYFYTLGCKVNQYETQAMRRLMEVTAARQRIIFPASPLRATRSL